ncbi:glycosyltransferase family 4 protein [Psychrobacter sanguinis]|uniref:glycosyltransferase family 4 protein n=1 Tax=Psychrobacter sanguinis TaxID=861445 RepID=UPI00289852DC|nr:glycosyltransferase family 4 protein [Psychrobacter sanguinis]
MKILLVTNIVSHHQLPLAIELSKIVGEHNFLFAAMSRPDKERLKNGWLNQYNYSWIVHPNESASDSEIYENFWDDADVVVCGERFIDRMQNRVNKGKLCFYMSERWWKPPVSMLRLLHPRYARMCLSFKELARSDHFHYLANGPFAAKDLKTIAKMNDRVWLWGYFTEVPKHIDLKNKAPKIVNILWIGRMLKCKRVDLLIRVLAKIESKGIAFKLTLVGDGPQRTNLERLAKKYLHSSSYEFINFIPSSEVLNFMSKFDIYVLPSNAYEGWGAVVNEAMSVGCAVIASDKTGAGATLIKSGTNGLLFKSGDKKSLYKCLNNLLTHKEAILQLGQAGYNTMQIQWSPKVAAERLVQLSNSLLHNIAHPIYENGPLSKP